MMIGRFYLTLFRKSTLLFIDHSLTNLGITFTIGNMRYKVYLLIFVIFSALFAVLLLPIKKSETVSCAGPIDDKILSYGYDEYAAVGEFEGKIVSVPSFDLAAAESPILGETTDKRIEVNLSQQRVYGYEGGNRVYEFIVSTGLWYPTPTGTFSIQRKVRAQKMSGGNPAIGTYYYLPNVPYVMFFGNRAIPWSRGFSFHGTYWHNNFGQPMSHGCVNMKTPEAQLLYNWAPIGTSVVIY